jgi:two-component system LytT family response regulator
MRDTAAGGIKALIVDDEPLARRTLTMLLEPYPDVLVVGECRNGREALDALASVRPDLLFLDVQMPELDGFELLRTLGAQCPPAVVLVTAYDEFAVRAFEAEALDFLVKPFSDDRFHRTLDRVRRRITQAEAMDIARRLSAVTDRLHPACAASTQWRRHLLVRLGMRTTSVPVDSIVWIEADDYYARLHVGAKTHLYRRSLTQLEQELDPRLFVRVHRSALVNLAFVRELVRRRGALHVVLEGGNELEVSDRRRVAVSRAVKQMEGDSTRPPGGAR